MRVLAIISVLAAAAPARAETVTLFGAFGVGGGTGRQESAHLMALLDARVWLGEHVGVFATASAHGAPDVRTAGTFLGAGATWRVHRWRPEGRGVHALEVGAALGRFRLVGSDDTNFTPDGPFDDKRLGWMVRAGGEMVVGDAFVMGSELAIYGAPGQGVAIVLEWGVGFAPF
jgi:hypothetical protein